MNRVNRININMQGYIFSASEEIGSLREEQLTFTFQQIQSNLDGNWLDLRFLAKSNYYSLHYFADDFCVR